MHCALPNIKSEYERTYFNMCEVKFPVIYNYDEHSRFCGYETTLIPNCIKSKWYSVTNNHICALCKEGTFPNDGGCVGLFVLYFLI